MPRALLTVAILLFSLPAVAGRQPSDLLTLVDAKLARSNDQYLVWEMATVEEGKEDRVLQFEATVKGKHYRRVHFLAPADVKGMKLLVRSPSQMYIYLPSFRKVRRVATHVQEQGFMGSAFDHAEVALATYGELFEATAAADHDSYFTLTLERREDAEFPHAKVELDILKDHLQVTRARYFNESGLKVKSELRKKFICSKTTCTPHHIEMVDHTRNELRTVLTLKRFETNVGVPDSFFTVRSLQRGN